MMMYMTFTALRFFGSIKLQGRKASAKGSHRRATEALLYDFSPA